MAARKIRDERDARRCLAAAKAAGLTRSEWARRNGVDGRSLFAWARNLERGDKARGTKAPGMVELVAASDAAGRYVVRCGQLALEVDEDWPSDAAGIGKSGPRRKCT